LTKKLRLMIGFNVDPPLHMFGSEAWPSIRAERQSLPLHTRLPGVGASAVAGQINRSPEDEWDFALWGNFSTARKSALRLVRDRGSAWIART